MAVKAKDQITLSAVVDVFAVYRYYKLQASTLAAPSKPTVSPPSGWSDTEPSYTSGSTNTLYTVDCNVFSDGTFAYSAVSKSSSYEAAKEAWNKADAAIVSSVEQFYLSTSATSLAGGSWSNTQPTWTQGKFIWRRTLVTYGSGRTEHTPSANGVCISGNTGPQGNTGQPGAPGADGKTLFGTCDTATGTAAKVVSGVAGFSLYSGVTVSIKFSAPNTAILPTLNVNESGAKPIMLNGANEAFWVPGATVNFVYDGASWQVCNTPLYGSTATIGNPAGGNVYVDGDSVSVRQGTSVLARLKAGLLELAANSVNAIIKLCGGKGTIAYYAETDQLAIMAPGSIAMAACQTLPDGTVQPYDTGVACNKSGVLLKGAVEASGTFKFNGNDMVDFVVAQGKSGIWRWRKWASGFAECWGATSFVASTATDNWHWVGYDTTVRGGHALPFAFKTIVDSTVTLVNGNYWAIVRNENQNNLSQAPQFWVVAPSAHQATVTVRYGIAGTWK